MSELPVTPRIQVGGTLVPGVHLYIVRPEDAEVLNLLLAREYCSILTARQMGKSSLVAHVSQQLLERDVRVVQVDLQDLGTPNSVDLWYQGLLMRIAHDLKLTFNVRTWWTSNAWPTPNQRVIEFFQMVGQSGRTPVVIFVDEIDQTLKLPYTDDFFAVIRSMYNQRGKEPAFARITFCLVGVASPNELIKDKRTTPYNIGRTIELRDFDPQRDDLTELNRVVCPNDPKRGGEIVASILFWTGGQPFLTTNFCDRLAQSASGSVDDFVQRQFGSFDTLPEEQRMHFGRVAEYLTTRVRNPVSALQLYQQICNGPPVSDRATQAHVDLKLCGIVKRDRTGHLVVRNPLYRRIFTDRWIESVSPVKLGLPTEPARLPAVNEYLRRLTKQTEHLSLIGLGRSLQIELPIAEAYVPLTATHHLAMEARVGGPEKFREGLAERERNLELSEVFREAAAFGTRGVVLLGEPGSGKTTGARQLAWRLASRQTTPAELGLPDGIVPVLLRFRHLTPEVIAEPHNGLRGFLKRETFGFDAPDELQSPGADLWNGKAGPLLWILDGLDDLVDLDTRRHVSGWIMRALENRPDDRFLVTCRFAGYYRQESLLPRLFAAKFFEFHVRPLDRPQIERFVRDWFAAAYRRLQQSPAVAAERSEKLFDLLRRPAYQAGHLSELSANPLLLTILCLVFHDSQTLPTNRAELYDQCVRVLLQYWRRAVYETGQGKTVEPYDADAAQAVLARLAWWLHGEAERTAAPLADLAEEAERGLAEISPAMNLGRDGRTFLGRMRDEAGILAADTEGRCGFLHLSFQEYLAATYAVREMKAAELASRADQSWWTEVALLSLRRSRRYCESFFRALLAAGIAERNPDLAERCLNESLFFTPEPFVELLRSLALRPEQANLASGTESSSTPERIAAVLRLLRDRTKEIPELKSLCRSLLGSADPATRKIAAEIVG